VWLPYTWSPNSPAILLNIPSISWPHPAGTEKYESRISLAVLRNGLLPARTKPEESHTSCRYGEKWTEKGRSKLQMADHEK